jgi:hypothetical protein
MEKKGRRFEIIKVKVLNWYKKRRNRREPIQYPDLALRSAILKFKAKYPDGDIGSLDYKTVCYGKKEVEYGKH